MNLDERISEKNCRVKSVSIAAAMSNELNSLLEKQAAIEDFLEKYQMLLENQRVSPSS